MSAEIAEKKQQVAKAVHILMHPGEAQARFGCLPLDISLHGDDVGGCLMEIGRQAQTCPNGYDSD
jgi:hypothetical protein